MLAALADLAATMVAIAQTRLALIELDLDRALARLVLLLAWWLAGILALSLAVVAGLVGFLLALAPEHRVPALAGTAVVLLLLGVAAIAVALERARRAPRWFAATLEELDKDHAVLPSGPP